MRPVSYITYTAPKVWGFLDRAFSLGWRAEKVGFEVSKAESGSGAEGRVDILNREGWSKLTKCIMGCLPGFFTSGPREATDCREGFPPLW